MGSYGQLYSGAMQAEDFLSLKPIAARACDAGPTQLTEGEQVPVPDNGELGDDRRAHLSRSPPGNSDRVKGEERIPAFGGWLITWLIGPYPAG